jgi:copper(I)-binding protein
MRALAPTDNEAALMRTLLFLFLLTMLPASVHSHEIRAGSLIIIHPHVDEAEKGQATARGSMEIRNEGTAADQLLSIKAEFAAEAMIETPGQVIIAPHERVLVPVTFHQIRRKLSEDESYEGELAFANAGTIKIDFMVHAHAHSSTAANLAQARSLMLPGH